MTKTGIILLAFGLLYLIKPDIYTRWLRNKNGDTQQATENYRKFMQVLGSVFVITGLLFLIAAHYEC